MQKPSPRKRTPREQAIFYLLALAVYTTAIYLPFSGMGPLPADQARFWGGEESSHAMRAVLAVEQRVWAQNTPYLWHIQTILCIYLASASVFLLTQALIPRPLWLSSFAAVLFMANPAKGDSAYAATAVLEWLPTLFALAALAAYAQWLLRGQGWIWGLAVVLGAAACLLAAGMTALLAPLLLLHWMHRAEGVRAKHFAAAAGIFLLCALLGGGAGPQLREVRPMALLLVLYPIGYLPETVQIFDAAPWTEWALFLVVAGIALIVAKKCKHAVLNFGLLSALAVFLVRLDAPDLVTLEGGGALLLPMALLHVALAALVQSIMQHPKWRKPMVLLTALWCVVYFVLQVQAGLYWRQQQAGNPFQPTTTAAASVAAAAYLRYPGA